MIYYKGAKFVADFSDERIHKRGRKKVYTQEIIPYLLEIRRVAGCISSIERLIKPYRDQAKMKKAYKSNPYSSNVKKAVPVESWLEKRKELGDIEVDLFLKYGEFAREELCLTITCR